MRWWNVEEMTKRVVVDGVGWDGVGAGGAAGQMARPDSKQKERHGTASCRRAGASRFGRRRTSLLLMGDEQMSMKSTFVTSLRAVFNGQRLIFNVVLVVLQG